VGGRAGAGAGGSAGAGSGGSAAGGFSGAVCPDYVRPDSSGLSLGVDCTTNSECGSGAYCRAPGEQLEGCGICLVPRMDCVTSADCDAGLVCHHDAVTCSCDADFTNSTCQPACTDATCSVDAKCNAESGLCEPRLCDDGYDCGADFECVVDTLLVDPHGCLPLRCDAGVGYECPPNSRCSEHAGGHGCATLPCATDTDCDCGTCIRGSCVSGPGVCTAYPV
jgi:hypothetical protein